MTSGPERRRHPRFTAWLPLRVKAVGGIVQHDPPSLVTQNLSKTGLCFPAPQHIEPGRSIEVEVILRGAGLGDIDVNISGTGYIVRSEPTKTPGWYKLAATFEEPSSGEELEWQKLVDAFNKKA